MRNKYRYFDRQIHFNIFCGGFHQFILYCISTNHWIDSLCNIYVKKLGNCSTFFNLYHQTLESRKNQNESLFNMPTKLEASPDCVLMFAILITPDEAVIFKYVI